LHTVIIQTSKMGELAAFYVQSLELVEIAPEPTGVISFWFEVDDLEETFQRFKKLGAEVKYPPTPKPWGAILAALFDPVGNLFGFHKGVWNLDN
jgi:predicted enzyme related to lactoylglutathione lyase